MIVKVCGMKDPDNIRAVAELGIDWMGFIFYEKSPRYIDLSRPAPPAGGLKRVGVFVNAAFEQMTEAVSVNQLDFIQLHGEESPELCHALQKRDIFLIKAFPVSSAEDLAATADYEGCADYFLFDTKCNGYGGSGKSFDWSALATYAGKTPFLLSGGINPQNVEAVKQFRHPRFAGIDLNSGFETAPGMKDVLKLNQFLLSIQYEPHHLPI
ncbi:N-(5'-phosphoribosyl)anthranilate isomerase [Bacteroidales bacterium Barb6XT]|nr:N-(5'-phosphoribosyl)anthranilate isomerase [Bacteroidales bacterium Barb6XT]